MAMKEGGPRARKDGIMDHVLMRVDKVSKSVKDSKDHLLRDAAEKHTKIAIMPGVPGE